jgi:hypothetical protein
MLPCAATAQYVSQAAFSDFRHFLHSPAASLAGEALSGTLSLAGENCHRTALTPPESSKCSHAQPISAAKVTANQVVRALCNLVPLQREKFNSLWIPFALRNPRLGSDSEISSK